MSTIVGVKQWAIVVGVCCVAAVFLGTTVALWQPSPPGPPKPCIESAEIRGSAESEFSFSIGAHLEIYPTGPEKFLAKCVCWQPKQQALVSRDAGVPSTEYLYRDNTNHWVYRDAGVPANWYWDSTNNVWWVGHDAGVQ